MITIYTRPSCAPCVNVKKLFTLKQVAYEEKNVEDDPKFMEEVLRLTGQAMVPCTIIGDTVISGGNIPAIMSALRNLS